MKSQNNCININGHKRSKSQTSVHRLQDLTLYISTIQQKEFIKMPHEIHFSK